MDYTNRGSSPFHDIQALYIRDCHGELVHVTGKGARETRKIWTTFHQYLNTEKGPDPIVFRDGSNFWSFEVPLQALDGHFKDCLAVHPLPERSACLSSNLVVRVQECVRPGSEHVMGIWAIGRSVDSTTLTFAEWFGMLILAETRLNPPDAEVNEYSLQAIDDARRITKIFDAELRNVAPGDKWISHGREYFMDRVRYFTARRVEVEFALPAFPCKSSNPQKTNGIYPDRAEELALGRLHVFCRRVREIYPPGAKVCIISDGHVFADCIGVDDAVVNHYGERLIQMNEKLTAARGGPPAVSFSSLEDFFFRNKEITANFSADGMDETKIPHFLNTSLTEGAETCRKLMMASCQISSEVLRSKIENADSSTLKLYRGFSKFMQDDIAEHPSAVGVSKKQKKKLSFDIAFEMIKRNQAYSNLVELLFPVHVRISIHAHDNSGPKFGVRLLSSAQVRPIESLRACHEPQTSDLLHIPTPWHNCLMEVDGHDVLYIAKSGVAKDALKKDEYEGSWVESEMSGGYFSLRKGFAREPKEQVSAASLQNMRVLAERPRNIMSRAKVVDINSKGATIQTTTRMVENDI